MCRKCYVTTPIYYASATPQIGNSYSTVACDTFARFNKMMNRETFFLTGMDEHGQKIEEAAKKNNMEPQAYVDKIAEGTKEIWKQLHISYNHFVRTTDDYHVHAVQDIFEKLLKNGDIYLGSYEGHYCVSCESFFTKTQLGENDTCPDCGKPTRIVSEESYFLNLKKYSDRLLKYIDEHPQFIVPESRKNEVVSFIKSGLDDLCVSRTSFSWGIPVLSNPKHVVYVWIDALSNYITALGYDSAHPENFEKFWMNNDHVYHVIGKDILRFHAIYWPIMLMCLDLPIFYQLVVHGWILTRDGKMSKSRGNAVYPEQLYSRYGADSVRYYLAKELPLGNDGLFSPDRFIERYNVELVNDLGNLVSRSISMVEKYFEGVVPSNYAKTAFDEDLEKVAANAIKETTEYFDKFELQNGILATWKLINRANKYIDETAPWTLAKDPTKKEELASVMYHLIESIRIIGTLTAPYLVDSTPKIFAAIGLANYDPKFEGLSFGYDFKNAKVSKPDHLFSRLDEEAELAYFESLKPVVKKMETKPEITIDDFDKLDIRIGEVIASKKAEKSDKLLVSQVKFGDEVRQIVSGIAATYDPSKLVGKKVVAIVNLKPVTIRGNVSNGMLLTAENGEKLELLSVNEIESGSIVK